MTGQMPGAGTPAPGPARGALIRLVGLVNGRATPLDGQWLVAYDPTRPGTGPGGEPMTAHIQCTSDRSSARRFSGAGEALTCWRAPSGRTRLDGRPDRPLTAYTVAIEPAEDDQ